MNKTVLAFATVVSSNCFMLHVDAVIIGQTVVWSFGCLCVHWNVLLLLVMVPAGWWFFPFIYLHEIIEIGL